MNVFHNLVVSLLAREIIYLSIEKSDTLLLSSTMAKVMAMYVRTKSTDHSNMDKAEAALCYFLP